MVIELQSDESEHSFADRVEIYLNKEYGEENVERNKYLEDAPHYDGETDRFVDFWVEGPLTDFAIELENDFESTFEGVGQSIVYSRHELDAVPVVGLPTEHVEQPEKDMLNEVVRVIEFK